MYPDPANISGAEGAMQGLFTCNVNATNDISACYGYLF